MPLPIQYILGRGSTVCCITSQAGLSTELLCVLQYYCHTHSNSGYLALLLLDSQVRHQNTTESQCSCK